MEESIYELVPRIPEAPAKPKKYRSKHDATVPPSYSTFPRKEQKSNDRDGSGAMMYAGRSGAMGRDVGPEVDPKRYLKAHSAKRDALPQPAPFKRAVVAPSKPTVPPVDDKPVMGLMTEKNFVHGNAVDAMCAPARHRGKTAEASPTARPDFGKPPAYLETMKQQVDVEKTMLADARAREVEYHASMKEQYVRHVAEEEKEEMIAALRQRWEEKHKQYHSLPFAQDTAMSIARKEAIERELKEIETALAKLSKKVVVVYNDRDGPAVARWARSQADAEANQSATRMVSQSIAAKKAGSR